jgi:hypothetical protein
MLNAGVGDAVLQLAIVGKQKQPFTIAIQPADWINIPYVNVILQRVGRSRKLAEDAAGLVQDEMAQEIRLHRLQRS